MNRRAAFDFDIVARVSKARRFDVLDKLPPAIRRRPGETEGQFVKRRLAEGDAYQRRMVVLLLDRYGIAASDPRAAGKLLAAVVRDYVPAFSENDRRGVGAPRKITDAQVRAINRATAGDKASVIDTCRKLVGNDKAAALAAAFRRATKLNR